ncbi:MAG: glycerol-3-phosphate dehydrogenase/oxidase [Actinomycetota bacterium]
MNLTPDRSALDRTFDLAVVGAGITGVCLAREAAARGRSVVVVDQGDFGSGTSAGITKYLHGGIRYLEQYDLRVVRESLRERRIMSLAAPHLVRPTPFVLPVWSWSKPGRLLLGAGVATYDALSFDRNREAPPSLRIGHPRYLTRAATLAAVPWLDPTDLRGAFVVTDTLNVHPERFLLALLSDAVALGAVALNHTAVEGFATRPGAGDDVAVTGIETVDRLDGVRRTIRAAQVINAAGPWMDEALRPLGRELGVGVVRSKGVHVLTRPLGGPGRVDHAVLARARSGRHVVVSPWQGRSFIGPTDTPIDDHPDDVRAAADDVAEVLATVNSCLGPHEAPLDQNDVEHATVGIRPLVVEEGKDTYSASRRHELYDHADRGVRGLWSIAGGKWTTGRGIAADVLDRVLGPDASPTERRTVSGGPGWAAEPTGHFETALGSRPELGLPARTREHLARLYGTAHERVLDLVAEDPRLGEPISSRPGCDDIGAQVVLAVSAEAARTLGDVIDRRLVLGTLGPVTPVEVDRVARLAAPLLGRAGDERRLADDEIVRRAAREAAWRDGGPGARPGRSGP